MSPDGAVHVNILTKLGDAFWFADLETERVPFGDITVSVVTPCLLYDMKKDTLRLKDRADARMLTSRARQKNPSEQPPSPSD